MTNEIDTPEASLGKVRGWSMNYFLGQNKKALFFLISVLAGFTIWMFPAPSEVDPRGWTLLAIFCSTILSIILKPIPMGATALLSLCVCIITNCLTFEEAFSGFSHHVVWLIVFAFFIARGFVLTGLGKRIAYKCMSLLGKNTLGLGYGVVATDLMLAPTIPSVTARSGGVLYPIITSISKAFKSEPHDDSRKKVGAYLVQVAFQTSTITSAMFLTSMAGNPLIVQLASQSGVSISWGEWALAAIVPGIVSLIALPLILFKIYPPELKETPDAKEFAQNKLKEIGRMNSKEWMMLGTFALLLVLWIFGSSLGLKASSAGLIGLTLLILTGVLNWKDVLDEKGAWDTLFWFASLVTIATYLNKFGVTTWFGNAVVHQVHGFSTFTGFAILALIYFYLHYFFASNLAHIGAIYAPFLIVSIALGVPAQLAALVLAFLSSLFGGLTHYGSGPAPIYFGSGYVPIGTWWKMGIIVSAINILIWAVIGGLWWKILGIW